MNPDIRDYIRANRATYTPESIRQQLLDAGHEPGAAEQTTPAPVVPPWRAIATAQFWLLLWLPLRRGRAAGPGVLSGLATAFVVAAVAAGLCVALLQNM